MQRRFGSLMMLSLGMVVAMSAATSLAAQSYKAESVGRDLPIAVALHPDLDAFDGSVQAQLEARVTNLVTGTGFAAVDGYSHLVVFPTLIVLSEREAPGLRTQTVVSAEISLFLKNVSDGTLFSSMTRSVTGAGRTRTQALMQAVSSLRSRDRAVTDFLESAREEIVIHYEKTCDGILTSARAAAGVEDHSRAIAELMAVPMAAAACHSRASDLAVQLVEEYQDEQCSQVVRTAEAEVAAHRYTDAISQLAEVDPSAPCADEADRIVDDIERGMEEHDEAELQVRLERLRSSRASVKASLTSSASVSKRRLEVGASMAAGYFNTRSATSFDPSIFRTSGG